MARGIGHFYVSLCYLPPQGHYYTVSNFNANVEGEIRNKLSDHISHQPYKMEILIGI